MANYSVTDSKFFKVGEEKKLTLKITVGYGQVGGSYVLLIDSKGNKAEISGSNGVYKIDNDILKMKFLKCVTSVQDIREETNETSVSHVLKCGNQEQTFNYSKKVENENDTVIYSIEFVLI